MRAPLVALVGGLVVLGGLGVWYFDSAARRDPATTAPQPAARRVVVATKVPGVMLINDARDARLGPATAVFAECALANPTAAALTLPLEAIGPEVRDSNDRVVTVTWERVGTVAPVIAPDTTVGLRWVATTRLPPGDYTVGVAGAATVDPGGARIHVEPAHLLVSPDTDADADDAAAIQLLAWRGQSAEALSRIDATLASTPDSLVMQLWRGDLLVELGRVEEATDQFTRLAAAIDVRQRARAGYTPELPFWLAERMSRR